MRIGTKIMAVVASSVVVSAVVPLVVLKYSENGLVDEVSLELRELGFQQAERVTDAAYAMVEASHLSLLSQLQADIRVAAAMLEKAGGVSLQSDATANWRATNQFTAAVHDVALPTLRVGDRPLKHATTFQDRVEFVDEVTAMLGAPCTVFQRMNEAGDMLRVGTTVKLQNGQRAVGTFIPATGQDGRPSPVVASLLRGETYIGRAFVVDAWCLTAYHPIRDAGGRVIGAVYVGRKIEENRTLRDAMMRLSVGQTGYAYVLGGEGAEKYHYVISEGGKRDGEDLSGAKSPDGRFIVREQVDQAVEAQSKNIRISYHWQNTGEPAPREKIMSARYFEPWGWVIGSGAYVDEFQEAQARIHGAVGSVLLMAGLASMVTMGVFGFVGWWVARVLVRPIRQTVNMLRDIAEGEGDLTRRIDVHSRDEVGELGTWFNTFIGKIHDIIAQVAGSSQSVAAAATQIAAASEEMAQGIRQQSQQSDEVLAASQQMSEAVAEVARQSSAAAAGAKEAGAAAETGGEVVREAIIGIDAIASVVDASAVAIGELGKRSQQIGEIIDVINDIADQTNLLALNAAIEAARAGEHGRGFAVVADEVRKLADRTTKATDEIGESIQAIQRETASAVDRMNTGTERVKVGVDLVQRAGGSLESIMSSSGHVSSMIQSIAAATEEQSAAAAQITAAIDAIKAIAQQSVEGAQQSATATAELSQQAETMQRLVGRFKLMSQAG